MESHGADCGSLFCFSMKLMPRETERIDRLCVNSDEKTETDFVLLKSEESRQKGVRSKRKDKDHDYLYSN